MPATAANKEAAAAAAAVAAADAAAKAARAGVKMEDEQQRAVAEVDAVVRRLTEAPLVRTRAVGGPPAPC